MINFHPEAVFINATFMILYVIYLKARKSRLMLKNNSICSYDMAAAINIYENEL